MDKHVKIAIGWSVKSRKDDTMMFFDYVHNYNVELGEKESLMYFHIL